VLLPVFRRIQSGEAGLMVSVVTESELLVRPERDRDEAAIERIGDLLSEDGIYVVNVDRRIGRRAARLRAENRSALPDAIIVATAIETGCDAIVTNDGNWRRVTDIPVVILDEVLIK
jgi:predicted nucleic acid-binding protein